MTEAEFDKWLAETHATPEQKAALGSMNKLVTNVEDVAKRVRRNAYAMQIYLAMIAAGAAHSYDHRGDIARAFERADAFVEFADGKRQVEMPAEPAPL